MAYVLRARPTTEKRCFLDRTDEAKELFPIIGNGRKSTKQLKTDEEFKSSTQRQNSRGRSRTPDKSSKKEFCGEDLDLDDILTHCDKTRVLSIQHKILKDDDMRRVSRYLKGLSKAFILKKLKLKNCGLKRALLDILLKGTKKKNWVKAINLSDNKNIDASSLRNLVCRSDALHWNLSDCHLSREHLSALKLRKVEILKLNYRAFQEPSVVVALAGPINNGLRKLSLVDCRISSEVLSELEKKLTSAEKLEDLDLSHNQLNCSGIAAIARIVNKAGGMEKLALSDCSLDVQCISSLYEGICGRIEELDLSSNEELAEGYDIIQFTLDKCGTKSLDFSASKLRSEHVKEYSTLQKPSKLQRLNISENPEMGATEVGKWVTHWQVDEVDLSECHWTKRQIEAFTKSLGCYKVASLDFSEATEALSDSKLKVLAALSEHVTGRLHFGCMSLNVEQEKVKEFPKLLVQCMGDCRRTLEE